METIYIKNGSPERIFHKEEFYGVVGEYMGKQAEEFMRKNFPTCKELRSEVNDLADALCDVYDHAFDAINKRPQSEEYAFYQLEKIEEISGKFDYDSLHYDEE